MKYFFNTAQLDIQEQPRTYMPHYTYCTAFTEGEIDVIVQHGDALEKESASVESDIIPHKEVQNEEIRITDIAWIQKDPSTFWFTNRIESIVHQMNQQYYNFDLNSMTDYQYTVYKGGGKYDYHMDMDIATPIPMQRKLTVVVFLSDQNEYEGGEFHFRDSNGKDVAVNQSKGSLVVFPSFMMHRVTPVTKGTRKSLVNWMFGPTFK